MTLTNNRPLIFDNRITDDCKVGINKKTGPEATLDVNGDTKIDGILNVNGDALLSGRLGLGADNYFGTAGAVLTSNGSNSDVSWSSPYLLRVFLPLNQSVTSNSFNTPEKVVNLNIDNNITTTNALSDFNNTTDIWTPPAGKYMINLQLYCAVSDDYLFQTRALLYKNGIILREARLEKVNNADGADIKKVSLTINDLIIANENDYFEFYIGGGTQTSNNWDIEGNSDGTSTFFSAYKIA